VDYFLNDTGFTEYIHKIKLPIPNTPTKRKAADFPLPNSWRFSHSPQGQSWRPSPMCGLPMNPHFFEKSVAA